MLRVADRAPAVTSNRVTIDDLAAYIKQPSWHGDALCREPAYVGLSWFPGRGDDTTATKAVCARCLVRCECLNAGMSEDHGIWGGVAGRARQRLRLSAA